MLTPEDLGAISAAVAVVVRDAVAPLAERLGGVEERLGGVEERLGGVEERLTGLETQLAELRSDMQTHFRALNERIIRLGERVAVVELKLDHALGWQRGQAERVDALEARIEALEALVKNLPSH